MSQPAVCKILQRQEARAWAELTEGDQRLQRRTALRLDYLYRQNLAGWHASRGERTTKRQRRVEGGHGGSGNGHTVREALVQTFPGDPRFLQNARRDLEALQNVPLPLAAERHDDRTAIDLEQCSEEELLLLLEFTADIRAASNWRNGAVLRRIVFDVLPLLP